MLEDGHVLIPPVKKWSLECFPPPRSHEDIDLLRLHLPSRLLNLVMVMTVVMILVDITVGTVDTVVPQVKVIRVHNLEDDDKPLVHEKVANDTGKRVEWID